MQNTAPGWYPDPSGQPGIYRYWDGSAWTADTTQQPSTSMPPVQLGMQPDVQQTMQPTQTMPPSAQSTIPPTMQPTTEQPTIQPLAQQTSGGSRKNAADLDVEGAQAAAAAKGSSKGLVVVCIVEAIAIVALAAVLAVSFIVNGSQAQDLDSVIDAKIQKVESAVSNIPQIDKEDIAEAIVEKLIEASSSAGIQASSSSSADAASAIDSITYETAALLPDVEMAATIDNVITLASADAEGEFNIENDPSNPYLIKVFLTEVGNSDVIYASGVIEPNYHIETAKLDKPLPAGTYQMTATFVGLDPITDEPLGKMTKSVELVIEG